MKPMNFPGRKNQRRLDAVEVEKGWVARCKTSSPDLAKKHEKVLQRLQDKVLEAPVARATRTKKHATGRARPVKK